jgi:predicted TIM-barrel fold metal-dependent hydrolase
VAGMAIQIPPIISVDDHVVEPPDLWQRWLPQRYVDAGPHVIRANWEMVPAGRQGFRMTSAPGPEVDFWVYGKFSAGNDVGMVAAGSDMSELHAGPVDFADMRAGCWQVGPRLADMDRNHVERSLCFPTFPRFCGQVFLQSVQWGEDRDLALACVRAYNDWMVDEWAGESGGRLIPLQIVPLWDPVLAGDEIRRNAARGVRGVTFSEQPQFLELPTLHDANRYWDPFLQACDDTGTVVCLHIGSSSRSPRSTDDSNVGANISLTSIASQYCMTDWLMSGALARFPNVKLAFSESQVGWMPFHIQRMDNVWKKFHNSPMVRMPKELSEPPSHYVRDRVFACIVDDDFGIDVRGGQLGVEQLTFESDYPHMDSSWPGTKEVAARALANYEQSEVDRVIRTNAIKLFGLQEQLARPPK